MVLKLDHVSFSCPNGFEIEKIIPKEYSKQFEEIGLKNILCKMAFLEKKSPVHNIYMYSGQEEANIPIEVTQYPEVSADDVNIKLEGRTIIWPVENVEEAVSFFCAFGGKAENDSTVSYKPFLDKSPFAIRFEKCDNNRLGYLDVQGYSSIGLFLDNVQKQLDKLAASGYMVSEVSTIVVDGKNMDIGFAKGKNNEIVEFIAMSKGR